MFDRSRTTPSRMHSDAQRLIDRVLDGLSFVVDEPMLGRSGLPATHPVAVVAATLGARISLESLARLPDASANRVLGAPRVLGDLALELPGNVVLDAPLPSGLVAGSVLVVRGRYVGKPPKEAIVRGRLGERAITHELEAHTAAAEAEAWVASLGVALGDLTDDGFARPPWHRLRQERAALAGIAQSGRGRELRG